MITVPSCPKLTNALVSESDLDAAVEQLFALIRFNFDRALVLRLDEDSGIDVSRAETELRLLDLFAVYFAIKTTDCENWKHVGSALFERVCIKVLASWAPAWDTQDDVIEVLKGRFAAYDRLAEASGPADINGMSLLVGLLCAATIQGDQSVFSDDPKTAGEAFPNVLLALLGNGNPLRTTAATVFRIRFDSVAELLQAFPAQAI